LKRGHQDEAQRGKRGLEEIFSDDEEEEARPYGRRPGADEFDGFIEDDYPEDDEMRQQEREEIEIRRGAGGALDTTGLDKEALQDMQDIFGDGEDYMFALEKEEEEDEAEAQEQALELKDVFEPSQLKEKLLTDEDNEIRYLDSPERFQIDRKPFKHLHLTPDQFKEEARWISNLLWPNKAADLPQECHGPFVKAVGRVLEFFVGDDFEVPYVFQHRKDYLLHTKKVPNPDYGKEPDAPPHTLEADKLIVQDDLWKILDHDMKFRSFVDKRNALEKTYEGLKTQAGVQDDIVDDMIFEAETMEELQDLQDYLQFQYTAELRDMAAAAAAAGENGAATQKRAGMKTGVMERVARSRAMEYVRAFGLTADQLAKNALGQGRKTTAEDARTDPDELADELADDSFPTGESVVTAARAAYAEQLFANPRMRKFFRTQYYHGGEFSCHRTDKGLRKIDEFHQFYDVKYLKGQTMGDMARQPDKYLEMLKAEEDGLLEVRVGLGQRSRLRDRLEQEFESENFSERAERWRAERKKVLDLAMPRLERLIAKGVKESMRTACQDRVLQHCRQEYNRRLDQAPYKPKGMVLGTTPRVLTFSCGMGDAGRDPIYWTWVDEDGRLQASGQFKNLARDENQRDAFAQLVNDRRPDVIGVSGFSAETARLVRDLTGIVGEKRLLGPEYQDPDANDEEYRADLLEVVVVNDEVARLYKESARSAQEHPNLNPMVRYCFALARHMQDPLREYAALGRDVASLKFHACQQLLPEDKLMRVLETAMVDMVNLVGVNINAAVNDAYTANLLPYVAGLGIRKAQAVLKAINQNGGSITTRDELVGDPDSGKVPVVSPKVFNNCASFLYIEYDPTNPQSDPLDNTRVHPEDYDLGRKMAADALELDEEDIKAETDENGPAAIVRKLFKDEEQERINELILEEYADQLLSQYNQRKRCTLETIRLELQSPYEEIRKPFEPMSENDVFTMLTGHTEDTLGPDMIVPISVRVVKEDFAIVKLDSGLEGRVEAHEVSYRGSIKDVLSVGQTTNAKILKVDHKDFLVKLTMREDALRRPYRKPNNRGHHEWDYDQEARDKDALRVKDRATGRAQRVIKHPLFKPFSSLEAEQYLGSQAVGDVVIRPSSKGNDHLAVTWKVADGVFQHIDVVELQKENEFSVGRTLRIGGKWTYMDLDELIVEHVKSMAKKVEEMTRHEKFRTGSKASVGE
jgi:transcription elongation factor SPT6